MLVKVVLLFLLAMVVIGWVGRMLGRGRGLLGSPRRPPALPPSTICRSCGRPRIGRDPCPCGAG